MSGRAADCCFSMAPLCDQTADSSTGTSHRHARQLVLYFLRHRCCTSHAKSIPAEHQARWITHAAAPGPSQYGFPGSFPEQRQAWSIFCLNCDAASLPAAALFLCQQDAYICSRAAQNTPDKYQLSFCPSAASACKCSPWLGVQHKACLSDSQLVSQAGNTGRRK